MDGKDCVRIFNAQLSGTVVSFQNEILPLISEYLTENNIENSKEIINLITQNPSLINNIYFTVVEFFRRKYNIKLIYYQNKPILYYE